jgi:hypothetical protein
MVDVPKLIRRHSSTGMPIGGMALPIRGMWNVEHFKTPDKS